MILNNKNFEQIIIGGLQRSGTSLVRAMIGSHPDISIYQWDLEIFENIFPVYGTKELEKPRAINLVNDILDNRKVVACDVKFDKAYFLNWIADSKVCIYFSDIYMLFLQYYLERTGRKYIGLKTPFNEFFANVIFDLFPKTKFIHVIRNPLDAGVSLKTARKDWWGLNTNFDEHIIDWKRSAKLALENREKYKERYFILKYEDLLSNPAVMAKNISKFLKVEFHNNMVQLNGQPGWTGTNSSFETTDSSIFKTSTINRYKNQLKKDVQMKYFYHLKELLLNFEYEVPDKLYMNHYVVFVLVRFPFVLKNNVIAFAKAAKVLPKKILFKLKKIGFYFKAFLFS